MSNNINADSLQSYFVAHNVFANIIRQNVIHYNIIHIIKHTLM